MMIKNFIPSALMACLLTTTSCSSIYTRTHGTQGKIYPGFKELIEYPGDSGILGLPAVACALVDLSCSAVFDTLMVPYDLNQEPRDEFPPPPPKPIQYTSGIFSGVYRSGFETSEFVPTTSRERWYLKGDPISSDQQLILLAAEQRAKFKDPVLFIIVEGDMSSPGGFGHLNRYKRELIVTRILDVRQLPPD